MNVTRSFDGQTDRYAFDFGVCSFKLGFAQVDTKEDASYFGNWAKPFSITIVSYAEGDITITDCDTDEEFVSELRSMQECFAGLEYGMHIDGMCVPKIIDRFTQLGLADLLH